MLQKISNCQPGWSVVPLLSSRFGGKFIIRLKIRNFGTKIRYVGTNRKY